MISKIAVMYYTEMGPAEKKFSVQFFLKCEKCGPKWVLQGKKIAAQKIWLVTFSFQGGDFIPLLAKLVYANTLAGRPSTSVSLSRPPLFRSQVPPTDPRRCAVPGGDLLEQLPARFGIMRRIAMISLVPYS